MEKVSWKKICTLVIGSVVLYWLLNHFSIVTGTIGSLLSLISPFILGGSLAFIINVPMSAIERRLKLKKSKRAAAYGITMVMLIAIIAFCAVVIVPRVVETIELIARQVPVAVASAQKLIEEIPFPELQKIVSQWEIDWSSITQKAVNLLQSSATGLINSYCKLYHQRCYILCDWFCVFGVCTVAERTVIKPDKKNLKGFYSEG